MRVMSETIFSGVSAMGNSGVPGSSLNIFGKREPGGTQVQKLSVIVPFFQREPGILVRALSSIREQEIPDGWAVDVIVVDDGSPCPAETELCNLTFDDPLSLRVIKQENGGVSAARNRALDELDEDTELVAFLDSDDIWPTTHLERAISALTAAGCDFCFTDSRRTGHYNSYVRERAGDTNRYIAEVQQKDGFSVIAPDEFVGLMVKEFPAQTSTVVYKRVIAPDLRFDTRLKAAGEDLLFLCSLVATAAGVAFDQGNCVENGVGINMYFSSLAASNPSRLAIYIDILIARTLINKTVALSAESKKRNQTIIKYYRRQVAFHIVTGMARFPRYVPKAVSDLIKKDRVAAISLPLEIIDGGFTLLGRYYMHLKDLLAAYRNREA